MATSYRPRPQARRFRDGDCPAEVLAIFDNKGASADRYTVIYKTITLDERGNPWLGLCAMNATPFHPQYGIGLYAEYRAHEIAEYRFRVGRREACRWTDLPEDVRAGARLHCARAA